MPGPGSFDDLTMPRLPVGKFFHRLRTFPEAHRCLPDKRFFAYAHRENPARRLGKHLIGQWYVLPEVP